jgi:hypothetical protein
MVLTMAGVRTVATPLFFLAASRYLGVWRYAQGK